MVAKKRENREIVTPTEIIIVVTAKWHNPSIPTKDWLKRNGVLTEEVSEFVGIPPYSSVKAGPYSFECRQDRVQLSRTLSEGDDYVVACNEAAVRMVKYIMALPQTPYTATGFNFFWLCDASIPVSRVREAFVADPLRIAQVLGAEFEAGMDFYSTYEEFLMRVGLTPDQQSRRIKIDYNFHYGLPETLLPDEIPSHLASLIEEKARPLYEKSRMISLEIGKWHP